jgi:CRP-like cAMP-binding protein
MDLTISGSVETENDEIVWKSSTFEMYTLTATHNLKDLITKIKSSIALSSEAEKYIVSISKERTIPKGDLLIRQGQTAKNTYFVTDGCLRSYCLDKNGKEHTLQFAIKDWWISDFIAIYNDELATLTIECVTDSKVIEFNSQELDEIFSKFPELESFQRTNLQRHVVSLHKRILNQLQLTAQERYDLFLTEYPDIEQFTPNYHIASYLGITQQSLSRIRAEKVKK